MDAMEFITTVGCSTGGDIGGAAGGLLGIVSSWTMPQIPGVQEIVNGVAGNIASDLLKKGMGVAKDRLRPNGPPLPDFGDDIRSAFHEAIQRALYDIGGNVCYPDKWTKERQRSVPQDVVNPNWEAGSDAICEVFESLRLDTERGRIFTNAPSDEQNAIISAYLNAKTPSHLSAAFYNQTIAPRIASFNPPPSLQAHLRQHLLDRVLVHLPDTFASRPDVWHMFNHALLRELLAELRAAAGTQAEMLKRIDALAQAGAPPDWDKIAAQIVAAIGTVQNVPADTIDTFMARVAAQNADVLAGLETLRREGQEQHADVKGRLDTLPQDVVDALASHIQPSRDEAKEIADAQALLATLPFDGHVPVGGLPSASLMPLSHNPLFTGREDELRAIAQSLVAPPSDAQATVAIGQVATAATTGIGGMGKTQLACEFVHRYGRFFAGGVFWLSFADEGAARADIARCGGVDVMKLAPDFGNLPLDDQVRMVEAAWRSPMPRLLVFDNCEDPTLLAQHRPTTGGCRVLITSRRANWDISLNVAPLPLETLSDDEGIALIRKFRPDLAADDPDVVAIVQELDGLPLALHLAGSVLKNYAQTITPANYLAQIQKPDVFDEGKRWLRAEIPSPTAHDMDVARTFALSYNLLAPDDATDARALSLVARAAYFAPGEPIPHDLLLATLGLAEDDLDGRMKADDSLNRLGDLGLIDIQEGGALRLHRLLGVFVRARSSDDQAREKVEVMMLTVATRLNNKGYPAPLLALQTHLRAITERALRREDERAAFLSNMMGLHLYTVGDYAGARPYYERALRICEQVHGPIHHYTVSSLNNLGLLLLAQGDYAAARQYLQRALSIRELVYGAMHLETAISLSNLAGLLHAEGDYAGARQLYERALAIREAALGPIHPDTATSLSNFGALLQAQGDYVGARPYFERALQVCEQVFDPTIPKLQGVSIISVCCCTRKGIL